MRCALTLGCLALLGCGTDKLDAVTGDSCSERPEQAVCALPSWPNTYSRANSDPWLAAHHDALRELHPRVLVLDFHNDQTAEQVRRVAQRQIDALAEGSRYHGYSDSSAKPFLHYELLDVIDLKDKPPPRDWAHASSTRVPLDSAGKFDLAALFGDSFSRVYNRRDENDALINLCGMFERGIINELWLAVGDADREPPSMVECKARYDDDLQRVRGALRGTSSSSEECARFATCGVSVRIAHLSPVRGVGCDLLVRGWAIRGSLRAIPYLSKNAQAFLDDCGEPEFPPNATSMWDFENRTVVQARCAHYAMRDGANGSDKLEAYSFDTVSSLMSRFPDCGGWWQIYWRQSIPGLDNLAIAEDGAPMKNWWPFSFY
jgi:hypothetical protein